MSSYFIEIICRNTNEHSKYQLAPVWQNSITKRKWEASDPSLQVSPKITFL